MNFASRAVTAPQAVDLAEEKAFRLGPLLVRPSTREIVFGGRSEIAEPRVMQVLVVLAQADGAVVSRDRLIERCWGGRIVGDDAVNNCVGKVRALASLTPKPAFEIETIPRVGYRLRAIPPSPGALSVHAETADAPAAGRPSNAAGWAWLDVRRPILFVLAGSLAAVAIVAGSVFVAPRRSPEWKIVESHMPFIATPMVERAPDFSPNGSMIVYSAGPDYLHRSIYLRLLSGGDPLRLIGPPLSGYSPVWSPDGTQIAFNSFTPGKEGCTIMLIAALGGQPREVGRCRTVKFPILAWDRTNTGILFNDAPDAHRPVAIYRLDLNGAPIRQLTHPSGGAAQRDDNDTISPDGKMLAFLRTTGGAREQVILHDLATGAERVLLSTTDNDDPFAWSNDSTTLIVGRNMPWDSSLWAYPVDGTAPQRITEITSNIGWVSSGPNGLIAVDLERSESDIAVASPVPGPPGKSIDANGPNAYSIAYSRDGMLAATAPRSGVTSLLLLGADGALHELLRLNSYLAGLLAWSADGARLAFVAQDNPDFAINIVNRQGRILKRIHYRAKEMGGLDWSEDGRSLLVTSEDAHGWRTWRLELAGNAEPSPVRPYGWMFVVSRGRNTFATKDGARGIWRLDSKPRRLTNWPDVGNFDRWELSGDHLIYADFTNPNAPVAMALPISGGPPKPIGYPAGLLPGADFAYNPKTGLVTYLRMTREDTDIGWLRVKKE